MKKFFASCVAVFAAIGAVCMRALEPLGPVALRLDGTPTCGPRLRQGGFVLLGRSYQGYPAGTIVELPASTEATMVAAGQATVSAGPPTTGPVTTTALSGCVGVAAGQSSLVVTSPLVTVQSLIWAVVAQAAADGTFLRVERVVASNGFFTIYGTANATATTMVDWAILNPNGSFTSPQ